MIGRVILFWLLAVSLANAHLAGPVKSSTRANGSVRTINYDVGGETTNIVEKTLGNFPIAFFTLGWTNSGRVAWEFAAPPPHSNAVPTRTMTYDDDNQLSTFNGTSVVHDDGGNMTSGPLTNNTFAPYDFDARNRLSGVGGLLYGYDPVGNRTSVTNGTNVVRYVVNPNAALPQTLIRTKADGSKTFYVYELGLLYEANFNSGGTELNTRTYHYDYRGSTVALTDGSGLPTDRMEYSPYGNATYRIGITDTPFLYNGCYGVMTDPNGLLYMQARYYNPYLSRFINADPSGFGGGLNCYAYADGDPISMVDPFGLGAFEAATGGSWLHEAISGVGLGDWANGFGVGLQSWMDGDDLDRYTPTGNDAYQSGVSDGYRAVPGMMELAVIALTLPTGGASEAGASLGVGELVASKGIPNALRAGQLAEGPALNALGSTGKVMFTPTARQIDSAAFKVIVGEAKYTAGGGPVKTIFDGATGGGLAEIKSGSSVLNSSYQLRLQTYGALITKQSFTIYTSRPINAQFGGWLRRWGVSVKPLP